MLAHPDLDKEPIEMESIDDMLDSNTIPIDVLLVMGNQQELLAALRRVIKPILGRNAAILAYITGGHLQVMVGQLGLYNAAVLLLDGGSAMATGSQQVVADAIEAIKPRCVIGCGLCISYEPARHQVGDILVSKIVATADVIKESDHKGHIDRGEKVISGVSLYSAFVSSFTSAAWSFKDHSGTLKRVCRRFDGVIASGDNVINSQDVTSKLKSFYPNLIGGDRDSSGIRASTGHVGLEFIAIKAVSEFAVGSGVINNVAVSNVLEFCSASVLSFLAYNLSAKNSLHKLGCVHRDAP